MFPDGCSSNVIWVTEGNGYIMTNVPTMIATEHYIHVLI